MPGLRILAAVLPVVVLGTLVGLAARTTQSSPKPPPVRVLRLADGTTRPTRAVSKGAVALVFCSAECPISNGYSPTLNALAKEFPADRVTLIGVYVDPDLSDTTLLSHAKEYELAFPVAADRSGRLARRLGVKVTPEVVVLDDKDEVRYIGRIDDQYAARGKQNANPFTHELKDAIDAVLAGRDPKVTRVEAVGCPLPLVGDPNSPPTYNGEVATILKERCGDCHRPGQVGPFPLQTYAQARKRAADIADVVETRLMPPWKASPDFGGPFKHDRSMTNDEIAKIVAWSEAGAPEGDPSTVLKAEPIASSETGWKFGTPDLVVKLPEEFAIPAQGKDIYRCFVVPNTLLNDVYVSAVEFRPGNRAVVHHVLAYVDTSGKARELDKADPGEGYSCFSGPMFDPHGDLGGWAPGNEPSFLPDGIGRSLPKGSDIVLQVHYHPSGRAVTDRTEIGLFFSKSPVRQVLHWTAAANMAMVLPKDQSRIKISARWQAPVDLDAYAVSPHMHLLGKDMTMTLTEPDGTIRPLIRIDDWDFQWQTTYDFKDPIRIQKGTFLDVVAHFDNSKGNPRNPNSPPIDVKSGEATTDEMCIGFLAVTKADQDLTKPGQVDDLGKIIAKSFEDDRRAYEELQKKAGR